MMFLCVTLRILTLLVRWPDDLSPEPDKTDMVLRKFSSDQTCVSSFPFSSVSDCNGNNSSARAGCVQSQRQTGAVPIFFGLACSRPSRHQSSVLRDLSFGSLNTQQ